MTSAPNDSKIQNINYDYPWEDAVIVAFRDVQWALHLSSVFLEPQKSQKPSPPPLIKFDGNAETASADVLTALNSKFFLFEFKRSKNKISDDAIKPMWKFFSGLNYECKNHRFLIDISRRCHKFTFAEKTDKVLIQNGLVGYPIELLSSCYYDEVKNATLCPQKNEILEKVAMKREELAEEKNRKKYSNKKDCSSPDLVEVLDSELKILINERKNKSEEYENILFGLKQVHAKSFEANSLLFETTETIRMMSNSSEGASFSEICAYINFLKDSVSDGQSTPCKYILATSNGLFWPTHTLENLVLMAESFLNNLKEENTPFIQEESKEIFKRMKNCVLDAKSKSTLRG
jgi:hypothetical protein